MSFNILQAVIFDRLGRDKEIDDESRKKIMVIAGMSAGTGLTGWLPPILMLKQAEETRDRDVTIVKLNKKIREIEG